jgi:hypothetical protein
MDLLERVDAKTALENDRSHTFAKVVQEQVGGARKAAKK